MCSPQRYGRGHARHDGIREEARAIAFGDRRSDSVGMLILFILLKTASDDGLDAIDRHMGGEVCGESVAKPQSTGPNRQDQIDKMMLFAETDVRYPNTTTPTRGRRR
jgi:hypothetical protein